MTGDCEAVVMSANVTVKTLKRWINTDIILFVPTVMWIRKSSQDSVQFSTKYTLTASTGIKSARCY